MKKIILNISLMLLSLPAICQTQKTVKLDSVVSVSLPVDFKKQDTLGQQTYSANSQYGYIMVTRQPNADSKVLKKEKELNAIFKEYIQKVQAALTVGTITDNKDTIINNLEVRDFVLRTDTGSGVQLRKFRILYTRPITYTFQYLYDDARKDVAAKEMDAFFKSIKSPPGLDGTDQYLTFGKWQGFSGATIAMMVCGVVIIAFVVVMVVRKRKKDREIAEFTGR